MKSGLPGEPAPIVHPLRPQTWPLSLWALLALALAVRLPGITYGLPSLFFHHDEPQVVLRALRFGTGDFNPHAFRWPGTWFMDLMFVVYAGWYALARGLGVFHGPSDFAAAYCADPTPFYLLGRGAALSLGLLTLPFLFALTERVAGRRAAPWACALLALNWLHLDLSRVAVPSVPMLFFVTVALYLMADPAGPGRVRSIALGVMCGFAASNLYYGGWALLAWPGILAARPPGGIQARLRAAISTPMLLATAGALAGLLASCPWVVLDFHTFVHDLAFVNAQYATWQGQVPRALLPLWNLWEVTGLVLPELVGWPAWILAIAGGVLLVRAGSSWMRGTLLYLAGFGTLLVLSRYQMPRYALPWLPILCVCAGHAWSRIPRGVPAVLAALLVLGWTAADAGRIVLDRSSRDTRELALEWVEAHIPAGSRVVLDALHHRNTFTAPLDLAPESVHDKLERLRTEPSAYGSSEAYRKYYEFLLAHPPPHPYIQEWTQAGTHVDSLEGYARRGFRTFMVSSLMYEGFQHHGQWEDNPAGHFYGRLEREGRLWAEFPGDRFLHPGPTIRIYDWEPGYHRSNRNSPDSTSR